MFYLTTVVYIMAAENIIIVAKISAQTFTKHNSQGTSFSKETIPLLSRKWQLKKATNTQNYFYYMHQLYLAYSC